jgi:hypothetical protein
MPPNLISELLQTQSIRSLFRANFQKSRIKSQRDRTLDAIGIPSDRKPQNRKRASVRISEAKALRDAKPNAPNRYGPF